MVIKYFNLLKKLLLIFFIQNKNNVNRQAINSEKIENILTYELLIKIILILN